MRRRGSIILDLGRGFALAGGTTIPVAPAASPGALRVGGPEGTVLRPLAFLERTRLCREAAALANPGEALAMAVSQAATVSAGTGEADHIDVLALYLAGADAEDTVDFSTAVLTLVSVTGTPLAAFAEAPAAEVDRLAADLISAHEDDGWTAIRFAEADRGEQDLAALRRELAQNLLRRLPAGDAVRALAATPAPETPSPTPRAGASSATPPHPGRDASSANADAHAPKAETSTALSHTAARPAPFRLPIATAPAVKRATARAGGASGLTGGATGGVAGGGDAGAARFAATRTPEPPLALVHERSARDGGGAPGETRSDGDRASLHQEAAASPLGAPQRDLAWRPPRAASLPTLDGLGGVGRTTVRFGGDTAPPAVAPPVASAWEQKGSGGGTAEATSQPSSGSSRSRSHLTLVADGAAGLEALVDALAAALHEEADLRGVDR